MKAVILAGGLGSRLSEETTLKPKPMVEIGGKPILWHIMKIYASHGIEEFVVCLGYHGYVIKEWFANHALHTSDVTFDLRTGEMEVHRSQTEPWRVTLIDTGAETMTGGRIKRILPYVGDESFCLTYGDSLADVDIAALVAHHHRDGRLATVTAVRPPGRFGSLELQGSNVRRFVEKPSAEGGWINGGFFVCEPGVGDAIAGDTTRWEDEPLAGLAADGQLSAYQHRGFWRGMDTPGERDELQALWDSGRAAWRTWR
ncbi:MAG: glucose-1-phosphate cytidylyltransferase [Solirubrobacteraceae bacterium]